MEVELKHLYMRDRHRPGRRLLACSSTAPIAPKNAPFSAFHQSADNSFHMGPMTYILFVPMAVGRDEAPPPKEKPARPSVVQVQLLTLNQNRRVFGRLAVISHAARCDPGLAIALQSDRTLPSIQVIKRHFVAAN